MPLEYDISDFFILSSDFIGENEERKKSTSLTVLLSNQPISTAWAGLTVEIGL